MVIPADFPIDQATKEWVDFRVGWILKKIGPVAVRNCKVLLPTPEFFPADYSPTLEGATSMLDQLCFHLGLPAGQLQVQLQPEIDDLDEEIPLNTVLIEERQLRDPLALVAAIAHQIAQTRLIEQIEDETCDDFEPLSNLLTVFQGVGVITANATIRDRAWLEEEYEFWEIHRLGVVTISAYGYALALFARIREESHAKWIEYLRLDAADAFQKSYQYLAATDLPVWAELDPVAYPYEFEDVGDYDSDTADENHNDEVCIYCGGAVSHQGEDGTVPDITDGICGLCLQSIHENEEDLAIQREAADAGGDVQLQLLVLCVFLAPFVFAAVKGCLR